MKAFSKILDFIMFYFVVNCFAVDPLGWNANPAKLAEPSLFIAGFFAAEVEERTFSSGGEIALKKFRLGFSSAYHELDSIYSQSYSEIELSRSFHPWVMGVGYGLSMEWLPGEAFWTRNRLKLGGAYLGTCYYFSALGSFTLSTIKTDFDWLLEGGILVQKWGGAFLEWNGRILRAGTAAKWKIIEFRSSYSFPEFGVELSLVISFGNWNVISNYGFSSQKMGWFGFGLRKSISKMTIF